MMTLIILLILGILAFLLLFSALFTVKQQTAAVIQRFGKFVRVARPGLNIKIPLIEHVAGRLSLRVQQLDVKVETKTKDNVFAHVLVSVQYLVLPDKVNEAFYKLDDPETQITAFVFDVVRAQVPNIILDDVFAKKDEIAQQVKAELDQTMDDFGYGIVKALVTDIDPDAKVKASMNEINAAQRLRLAAQEKGEADRILKVKAAEAESQSKELQGQGIAKQRQAIVNGLRESVEAFKAGVPGSTEKDVLQLVMLTQFFDTIKEIGANSGSRVIFLPYSPDGMQDIGMQIQSALAGHQPPEAVAGEKSHE